MKTYEDYMYHSLMTDGEEIRFVFNDIEDEEENRIKRRAERSYIKHHNKRREKITMDCNNYSYSNSNGRTNTIAEVETETGNRICFTMERNYFGDHFYFVADIFGEIEPKEFEFSSIDETGESERMAYSAAAKYYNSFMTEENAIPMF